MDHATRAVVAQRQVDGAPGEVPGFRPLLADLDLADTVVTADALQRHRDAAEFLVVAKRAHYLLAVKANQPTLLQTLRRACLASCSCLGPHMRPGPRPSRDPHPEGRHGASLRVPHAAQVVQVTRKRRGLHTRRWRTVTAYAITSLTFAQASPARLADLLRASGRSRMACTGSATSPSPRMAPRSAPGPHRRSWPACATSSSAHSAAPGRSTSPPRYAATPATHADPSPLSGSDSDETDITQEHRSPASASDWNPAFLGRVLPYCMTSWNCCSARK